MITAAYGLISNCRVIFLLFLKLRKSRFRLRTNRNSLLIVISLNSIINFSENYFLNRKRNGRKRVLENGFFCHLFLRKSSRGFSDLQRKVKKLLLLPPILGKPFIVPFNRNILDLR